MLWFDVFGVDQHELVAAINGCTRAQVGGSTILFASRDTNGLEIDVSLNVDMASLDFSARSMMARTWHTQT